eukprot:TRINITY_DN534_c0_g1_i1.p1 TRINITY_DN534_c0_g1~~TRINITY_DN534_c0_g1_i1.p1  ORF type:complete len:398 (-),score=102.43 TRINITY_DN534_c0_g1_i1:196-1389(-)
MYKNTFFLLVALFCCFSASFAFDVSCSKPGCHSHRSITKESIKKYVTEMKWIDLNNNTNTNRQTTLRPFFQAMEDICTAVFRPHSSELSAVHFDSEDFVGSQKRMHDTHIELVKILNSANYSISNLAMAREKLGTILHTLQDFYAHSNYVEIIKNDPNNETAIDIDLVFSPKIHNTCVDEKESDYVTCSSEVLPTPEPQLTASGAEAAHIYVSDPEPDNYTVGVATTLCITSGYSCMREWSDIIKTNKCGLCGPLSINKDRLYPRDDVRFDLHPLAGRLAIHHGYYYLASLYDFTSPRGMKALLGVIVIPPKNNTVSPSTSSFPASTIPTPPSPTSTPSSSPSSSQDTATSTVPSSSSSSSSHSTPSPTDKASSEEKKQQDKPKKKTKKSKKRDKEL